MKNYHTHTFRCNHAEGDAVDYAQEAVKQGITVLGITDHTPLPDDRWPGMRMSLSELPEYVEAIELAQTRFPELTIFKGMECEYRAEYENFYRDVLLGEYELDYLILGAHFFPYNGQWESSHASLVDGKRLAAYADYVIRSIQSGLFAFVAHPDLFGMNYPNWDENTKACARDILSAAEELQIPLEINGYGFRKAAVKSKEGMRPPYPWRPFWELAAEYRVSAVVNSDAHRPQDVGASIIDGLELANELRLPITEILKKR